MHRPHPHTARRPAGPLLALLVALAPAPARGLEPTAAPVSPAGVHAIVDAPAELHLKNTGGMGRGGPGTGAGLCVPSSIELAARYQGLAEMDGYQKWCQSRPGGSYPQKTAADLKEFCAQKGVAVPPYVQHTGGDAQFLELVYRTRRAPAQTWTRAHMVTGAHLDATTAAVIDNNRPGHWLWQSRREYLSAWNASGPGWAFVWLAPPPPPGPEGVSPPAPRPLAPDDGPLPPSPRPCPGPNCPRWQTLTLAGGEVVHKLYAADGLLLGALLADGWHPGCGDGWLVEAGGRIPDDAPPLDGAVFGAGPAVDCEKIDRSRPRYWIGEREVSREEAVAAVGAGLADDSGNHFLSIVSPAEAPVRKTLADPRLAPLLTKCHVGVYAPDSWIARSRLRAPVTLIAPATKGGAVIGTATSAEADDVLRLIRPALDPSWKPDPPPTPPAPPPATPTKPDRPAPPAEPAPPPAQSPEPPKDVTGWLLALLASILAAYKRK